MSYINNLNNSIEYMENNLNEKITIEDIANISNYSLYHFSRVFTAIVGETPISYLRKRRLSEALIEIKNKNPKLIEVAIKYQFGSQEAFTRSFKKNFKISPSKVKNISNVDSLLFQKIKLSNNIINSFSKGDFMEPKFIKKDKTILVGLLNIADKNSNFGEFWDKFFPELNNISNRSDYTVCYGLEAYPPEFPEPELFYYMPCVEVKNIDIVPNNMFIKVLPETEYAVFTVKGLQNISKTFDYVFHYWLPNSGYQMSGAYDFEYYDERFDPNNENSEIDLYIPIKNNK